MGYLPIPIPFLDIFAKAGVARLSTNVTDFVAVACVINSPCPNFVPTDRHQVTDTRFAYGAGVQSKFPFGLILRGEYERISSQFGDPDALMVSARVAVLGAGAFLVRRFPALSSFPFEAGAVALRGRRTLYCAHDIPRDCARIGIYFWTVCGGTRQLHAKGFGNRARAAERDSSIAVSRALRTQVDNIVVIYAENRAFDNLYGNFPGARGLNEVLDRDGRPLPSYHPQLDRDGSVLSALPPTWGGVTSPGVTPVVTQQQSVGLPNAPYSIEHGFTAQSQVTLSTCDRDARSVAPILRASNADRRREE